MPTLRALKQALIGPTIATQHAELLNAITDREQRLREVPAIRRRIGDRREEVRAKESQLTKAGGALRGYEGDPLRWSVKASEAREGMASLRREIEDLTAAIAADEKALSEIAAFALPPVSIDLMRHHREQVEQAQATVAKIAAALDASKAELASLSDAPGPAAIRRELSEALSGQALGTVPPEEVEAIEARLTQAEAVATTTGAKARRVEATITGLEQRLPQAQADLARLTSATPALQWEVLSPELGQAETRYRDALAALVQASDRYRALATIMSGIRPEATPAPLPEPAAALRDPGQIRLAAALEREQARLSAMGI